MRTRYLYRPEHPQANERGFVDASEPDIEPQALHAGVLPVVTDLYMNGVRAADGADIGSRSKRRAYMDANNLADYDDFKGTREAGKKQRDAAYTTGGDHKARKEQIGRALYQLKKATR